MRGCSSASSDASAFLERLADPARPPLDGPILIVVAHPDDEAIGCGAQLSRMGEVVIVHVTDGAPAGPIAARALGFADRESYARARAEEARAALQVAGAGHARLVGLGIVDQQASFNIGVVADRIAALIRDVRPRELLTHTYEGGHPDHDSTAASVRLACTIIAQEGVDPPCVVEMPLYHREGERMVTGRFLRHPTEPEVEVELGPAERRRKQEMLDCYCSQRPMLGQFESGWERYRMAPDCDYREPPHEGPLWYELFDWGVDGTQWRALAAAAFAERRMG
jgi:LmbE family N-acetylglucosaminyl deacetylase